MGGSTCNEALLVAMLSDTTVVHVCTALSLNTAEGQRLQELSLQWRGLECFMFMEVLHQALAKVDRPHGWNRML